MRISLLSICIIALGIQGLTSVAQAKEPSKKPVKIYLVAGQSNAEQRGNIEWAQKYWPEYTKIRQKLWNYRPGVKPPSPFLGESYSKFGVEFVAGMEISDAVENDVIFLTSAVGGTTLYNQWRPPSGVKRIGGKVGSLYERLLYHTHSLVANLETLYPRYKGQGYELAGMIWFQGENDCFGTFPYYQDLFIDFINDVRKDLGTPNLPIFIAKINDAWCGEGGEVIRRANEHAIHTLKNVAAVHTHDQGPKAHYNTPSYVIISQRLAKVMLPYARKPVHVGTKSVQAAGKAYFARIKKPVGKPDMASLKTGLIDYYQFDDMTASSSVHGAKGKLAGDETFGKPKQISGKFGKTIKLNGKQQIVLPGYKDPTNAKGAVEQFSMSFWAKNFGGTGTYRIGKGKGRPISESDGTRLDTWFWSQQANALGWDIRGFSRGSIGVTSAVMKEGKKRTFSGFSPTGFAGNGIDWIHIVVVYDAKNRDLRIYRNAELCTFKRILDPKLDTGKHAKRMAGPVGVPVAPIRAAMDIPLTIGGGMAASAEFQCYDELAIWSRPLTQEEVRKLYNGGAGARIPTN
jgi:hypothetical protein